MIPGVAAESFAPGGMEQVAKERAAIARSRLGWPQVLHLHRQGEACDERCETIDDPALPTVAQIVGSDPGFTGGLSAEAYVREGRE